MIIEPETGVRKRVCTEPREVIAYARETGVKMVDLKFVDLPGTWQHFTIPVHQLDESAFTKGLGFDGSSIRGFQAIHESDMLLIPDPTTAVVDPICKVPTLSIICDVRDPVTGEWYSRDPRYIAKKAERYLVESGIATVSYWGPEAEFFIFTSIRFDQGSHFGYYFIDSDEGIWNSGADGRPNLGYRPRYKEGYFPVPPTDKLQDLRSQMVLKMLEVGIDVETHHHEVSTAGQAEIDMRFDSPVQGFLVENDRIAGVTTPTGTVTADYYVAALPVEIMRTLAGLLTPARGTITLQGRRIEREPGHRRVELGMALVPEGRRLFGTMTVLENLEVGSMVGIRPRTERLTEVLELFPDLRARRAQLAGTLSGGEARMLACGRALMQDPTLLLLDEPTAGLSPLYVDVLFDKIKEIHEQRGTAIVLAEQNATKALQVAHRVMVLSLGEAFDVVDAGAITTQQLKEGYRI